MSSQDQNHENQNVPESNPKNWSIIGLFVILLILFFFIGRMSKKVPDPEPKLDVSGYYKTIDCLSVIANRRQDTVAFQRHIIDSTTKQTAHDHKKIKSDVNKIKTFTPTDRDRFRDSVKRSNGIGQ